MEGKRSYDSKKGVVSGIGCFRKILFNLEVRVLLRVFKSLVLWG